jgi:hypothetical protein
MWEDQIVAEIRRIREEIAARHNYDLDAIFQSAREREKSVDWETVTLPPRPAEQPSRRPKAPLAG